MNEKEWKSEVSQSGGEDGGYWLGIWTGANWEYFTGPYTTCGDAERAIEEWTAKYMCTTSDMLRVEEYWIS